MDTTDNTSIAPLFAPEPASAPPAPAEQAAPFAPQQTDYNLAPTVTPPVPPVAPAEPQPHAPQTVPLAELIETRRRAQAAEQERQEIRQQNAQLMEALQRLTRPQQPAPQPIDPIADPEGAYHALEQRTQQMLLNQQLNFSEMRARDKFGGDVVDRALEAARQSGYVPTFVNRPDAYGEMVSWYQSQQVAQTVGTDLAAYEAQIRAKVIAELRAGATPPQNLPPSLSQATKTNGAPVVLGDDKDFFKQTMNPRRG